MLDVVWINQLAVPPTMDAFIEAHLAAVDIPSLSAVVHQAPLQLPSNRRTFTIGQLADMHLGEDDALDNRSLETVRTLLDVDETSAHAANPWSL